MTDTTGTNYNTRIPTPVGDSNTTNFVISETITGTFGVATDTRKLVQLPKGVTIGGGCFVQLSDADTNATPTFVFSLRVTNGVTTKVIIHQSTAGQAGGLIRPTKIPATEPGVGYTVPADGYWIDLYVDTAQATAAATTTLVYGIELDGYYAVGAVTNE